MSTPHRRLAVTLLPLFAVLAAAFVTITNPVPLLRAQASTRVTEPLILTGAQLAAFSGAPVQDLKVRFWDGSNWGFAIAQVDERNSSGRFVASEDGKLDANDVLVFLSDRLDEQAPADAWPGNLSKEHARIELSVTDPSGPAFNRFAYVFWATQQGPAPEEPVLIQFDPASHEIRTDVYTLALAGGSDGFIGMKGLTLFGGPNLIDRLKMRVSGTLFGGLPVNYNEETIGIFVGTAPLNPVVIGPVRLLFDSSGKDVAYPARASLFGSLASGDGSGLFEVSSARLSLDLSPAAVPATYRDPNVPAGVPIDGQPDAVPASPMPSWHEVRFTAGRLISAGAPPKAGSTLKLYYKDDARPDSSDTGDKMSYGDSGVSSTSTDDAGGPPPQMIFLRSDDTTTAEQVSAQLQQPLKVTAKVDGVVPTAVATGSVTPSATATATATRTATRIASTTATPTRGGGTPVPRVLIFLPVAKAP